MIDVLNLALPYFGLIFLGFACGRITRIPVQGLAWMDFFIIYMALPALFYRILAKTPFEQLNNVPFIVTATLGTFLVLMLSLGVALPDPPRPRAGGDRAAGRRLRQHRLHGAGAGAGDARRAGRGAGGADLLLRDAAVLFARAVPDGAGAAAGQRRRARSRSTWCARSRCIP